MWPCEASSARSRRTRTSAAWVSARSTAASTMSSTRLGGAAVGRARRGLVGAEPAARGAAHAGRREAGLDEQGLDALLVDGGQHLGQAAGGAPGAAAEGLGQPRERRVLAGARGRLDARRGRAAHVVGARVLDVEVQPPGEALAQVGVQVGLEVAGELVRGADQDPRGQIVLEVREGDLGRVAQVVVGVLVDRALVVGLRPAALVVAAAQLVLDELDLLERRARTAEQPRHAAVDEQRAPALGRADGRQRLDEGGVGDHRVVVDGLGELEDLEEVGGARGEDGQAVGALGVQAAAAELGLDALEVGAQRRARGVAERRRPRGSGAPRGRAASGPRCCAPAAVANSRGSRLRKSESTLASPARMPARRRRRSRVMSLACMRRRYPCGRALGRGCTRRSDMREGAVRYTGRSAAVRRAIAVAVRRWTPAPPWGARLTPQGKEVPHAFSGLLATILCLCNRSGSKRTMCASS